VAGFIMHGDDWLGVLGSALVFASFWMKSSIPLRAVALASNVVFIAYAYLAWLPPILVLHTALLPLNVVRLRQLWRTSSDAKSGKSGRQTTPLPNRVQRAVRHEKPGDCASEAF
jgi:hypothetical protein